MGYEFPDVKGKGKGKAKAKAKAKGSNTGGAVVDDVGYEFPVVKGKGKSKGSIAGGMFAGAAAAIDDPGYLMPNAQRVNSACHDGGHAAGAADGVRTAETSFGFVEQVLHEQATPTAAHGTNVINSTSGGGGGSAAMTEHAGYLVPVVSAAPGGLEDGADVLVADFASENDPGTQRRNTNVPGIGDVEVFDGFGGAAAAGDGGAGAEIDF